MAVRFPPENCAKSGRRKATSFSWAEIFPHALYYVSVMRGVADNR